MSRWKRFKEESSFLRHYLWKYRKFVSVGLFALLVTDLLETLPPILLKRAVDTVVESGPKRDLLNLALMIAGIALVQAVGRYGWRMFLIRSSMFAGRDLREKFAHHLFGLSASFFDRKRIGDLMSLGVNDVDAIRMAIGAGLLTVADAMIFFVTVPIAMYLLSPQLTLLAFLPLPIIPLLVMRNEKEIHARFEKVQGQFGTLAAMAQENLNGIRVVKGFARENVQDRRFREQGEKYVDLSLHLARVQTAFGPSLDFTMSLGLITLLYVGGNSVIEGAVTVGTFVAFHRYIQKMIWPMTAIGLAITYYQRAVASSGRMKGILAERTDVPEIAEPRLPADFQPGGAWRTRGEVEFRGLSFRFPTGDRDALSGIDLKIGAGERVALVGAIGAGKSALLSLLPRMYPVASGMLFVDGVDVNHWPIEELRKQVGYVGQEVFLFSESVVENVAFGLHEWTTRADRTVPVEDATQLASVHDDLLNLSEGYQTRLGERGVNLSGGQKQRLTIARALAKQPPILVLDDALSSVDVQTEERILRGLRSRSARNTEIIAAHRVSTIKDADRIVVLEQGRVTQQGTHAQLMRERSGAYWKFCEQQRLKEDLEHYIAEIST